MRNSQRHPYTFNVFSCRTEYLKSFFFHVINEWNELDSNIHTSVIQNTVKHVYSEHLVIAATFSWNRPNHDQTHMEKPLHSG